MVYVVSSLSVKEFRWICTDLYAINQVCVKRSVRLAVCILTVFTIFARIWRKALAHAEGGTANFALPYNQ